MPFTLSHAVAVLPLATRGPGQRLIPAALVIGSWIPDLPYFLPFHLSSEWTHAASGPVTIDLLLGLAVFMLWEVVLRRPLSDLAPGPLRLRLPAPHALRPARWLAAAVSIVLGAITHVVWDTFTHHDRWGTTHLAALNSSVGGLPLYKWLQYGSGAFGLAGLTLWLLLWFRRASPDTHEIRSGPAMRATAYALLSLTIVSAAAASTALHHLANASVESLLFEVVTTTMAATTAAVITVCLLWHVRFRAQSSRRTL